MELPRGKEEGEIWPPEKETESQLPNCQANETTSGVASARAAPSGDALVQYADGLTQETFKICKEYLRPFKKCLRKLNLPRDFPKDKRVNCTRKNLIILGDHINKFLQDYCKKWELKHWKKMLWRFVALFSDFDEKQLCKLYHYSKTDQRAKFLKTYSRLEKSSLVALPEKNTLMQPTESSPRKRLQKSSSRTKRKGGTDKPQPTQEPTAYPSTLCSKGTASPSTSREALLNSNL